jgi:hypothetical protein
MQAVASSALPDRVTVLPWLTSVAAGDTTVTAVNGAKGMSVVRLHAPGAIVIDFVPMAKGVTAWRLSPFYQHRLEAEIIEVPAAVGEERSRSTSRSLVREGRQLKSELARRK